MHGAALLSLVFVLTIGGAVAQGYAPTCAVCTEVIEGIVKARPHDRTSFYAAIQSSCNYVASYRRPRLTDRVCSRMLGDSRNGLFAVFTRNGGVFVPVRVCAALEFC